MDGARCFLVAAAVTCGADRPHVVDRPMGPPWTAGSSAPRLGAFEAELIRLDAVQRSLAVHRGKLTEHVVPYLPGFNLDPKDVRFLGTPIDLIAFDSDDERLAAQASDGKTRRERRQGARRTETLKAIARCTIARAEALRHLPSRKPFQRPAEFAQAYLSNRHGRAAADGCRLAWGRSAGFSPLRIRSTVGSRAAENVHGIQRI